MFKYHIDEDLATKQFIYMYKSRISLKLKLLENFRFPALLLVC